MLYQGAEAWHVDDDSSAAPAQLTRYEAENLYMVWMSKDPIALDEEVMDGRPQRGLSGTGTDMHAPSGTVVTPRLGSVLMKYFLCSCFCHIMFLQLQELGSPWM